MDIVFMGTPEFAVESLNMLVNEGYNILAVITQPDKPRGRGNKVSFCDVKKYALKHDLNVLQPKSMKKGEIVEQLKSMKPDLFITAAYGKILTKEVLDIPKHGCINVHASILPKYRGAAPINWAIINGDEKTGITTMMTDIGVDSGDILLTDEISIDKDDTARTLHDKLSVLGAKTLKKTLKELENNTLKRIPQDNSKATHVSMMNEELGKIDWTKDAIKIFNLVRGTNPWPGAYTYYDTKRMRIWRTEVVEEACTNSKPGTILGVTKEGLYIATGKNIIKILEVQFDSCRRMCINQYICGNKIGEGEILGE
jgi:methionyl-tRNA formyltransferase